MIQSARFAKPNGRLAMITIPNWMFLSIFDQLRGWLLANISIETLCHNGRGVFGSDFGSCGFTMRNRTDPTHVGVYKRLFDKQGSVSSNEELALALPDAKTFYASNAAFAKLPGATIAYWLGKGSLSAFANFRSVGELAKPRQGMSTNDNTRFLRQWHEVSIAKVGLELDGLDAMRASGMKWFPYNKGGEFRKWFGNAHLVVNWENDGTEIKHWLVNNPNDAGTTHWSRRIINTEFYGKPGLTWTFASSSSFGIRFTDPGFLFDVNGSSLFPGDRTHVTLGLLCSTVASHFLRALNPSISFQSGNIADVPWNDTISRETETRISSIVGDAIAIARRDWNCRETAWGFRSNPFLSREEDVFRIGDAFRAWESEKVAEHRRMKELEEENNRLFIEAYGLQDELFPEVPDDQITLYRPDRAEDIKRLLSYAIGCMMGRYSLDKPGLIYAHSGNQDFDSSQYTTFRADDDGIIPILETDWGIRDDATNRFVEFIGVAWPKEHLEENLKFVADSLGATGSEHPRDTIRRYLATGFYKHHLSMYKKRPIYWLFSSGKQRAFQCLVYLHRYNEGTLARMRTEYVIPLQGQIAGRIEQLEGDKLKATSTSHRKKLQKEQDDLKKQQNELLTFEEKLKHAADQKISLDLDDGVKVNYAKFGDLLAESKAICGTKDED